MNSSNSISNFSDTSPAITLKKDFYTPNTLSLCENCSLRLAPAYLSSHSTMPSVSQQTTAAKFRKITLYFLTVLGALMISTSLIGVSAYLSGICTTIFPPSLGNLFLPGLSAFLIGIDSSEEAKSVDNLQKSMALTQTAFQLQFENLKPICQR